MRSMVWGISNVGLCNFHDSMVQAFDSGQFYGLMRLLPFIDFNS